MCNIGGEMLNFKKWNRHCTVIHTLYQLKWGGTMNDIFYRVHLRRYGETYYVSGAIGNVQWYIYFICCHRNYTFRNIFYRKQYKRRSDTHILSFTKGTVQWCILPGSKDFTVIYFIGFITDGTVIQELFRVQYRRYCVIFYLKY